MRIVEWDYKKLRKLKPNYKDVIRIAFQTVENEIYFAKMDTSIGDVSGKFGLKFDNEKAKINYKELPEGWKMYLIYTEGFEDMYRKDQEKLQNRLKNTAEKSKNNICFKCEGTGSFTEYWHIDKGICFNCNGKGYI